MPNGNKYYVELLLIHTILNIVTAINFLFFLRPFGVTARHEAADKSVTAALSIGHALANTRAPVTVSRSSPFVLPAENGSPTSFTEPRARRESEELSVPR